MLKTIQHFPFTYSSQNLKFWLKCPAIRGTYENKNFYTLNLTKNVGVYFKNEKVENPIKIKFIKVDQNNKPLTGAVLSVLVDDKLKQEIKISKEEGVLVAFEEGTFRIVEKTAPEGYSKDLIDFILNVTIDDNDKLNVALKEAKENVMVTYNLSKKSLLTTPNYDNAIKIGYLQVYIEGFFKKKFKEKFIVLSDIGLMILDTPNTMPQMVVPIIGSEIKKVDFMKYNVYAFSIKTPNGEICIFGARTEGERQAWCDEFSQIKSIYKEKMKMVEKKK